MPFEETAIDPGQLDFGLQQLNDRLQLRISGKVEIALAFEDGPEGGEARFKAASFLGKGFLLQLKREGCCGEALMVGVQAAPSAAGFLEKGLPNTDEADFLLFDPAIDLSE